MTLKYFQAPKVKVAGQFSCDANTEVSEAILSLLAAEVGPANPPVSHKSAKGGMRMNVFEYEHVSITGMDAKLTHKDDESALHYVYLRLSKNPSPEWARDFDEAWKNHIYGIKRSAQVSGDCIVIRCALKELESDHKAELEKIVKEVDKRQETAARKAHANKIKRDEVEREELKRIEETARQFNKKM